MFGWTQERTFVLTDIALYNIHKKEIKRKILLEDIGGITRTVPPSKALEFTVHVPIAYDYRFNSHRRDEIIDLIKRLFICLKGSNCPQFMVTAKNLNDYTTTESYMKKNKTRFPPPEFRDFQSDLIGGASNNAQPLKT